MLSPGVVDRSTCVGVVVVVAVVSVVTSVVVVIAVTQDKNTINNQASIQHIE